MKKTQNIPTLRAENSLSGNVQIPGDKSISHRSIMLASIAKGTTEIYGLLEGEDVKATIAAFTAMGVAISKNNNIYTIHGVGLRGLQPPTQTLDMGNSGTTARLIMGILAGQDFATTLTGDASLCKRPMRRVTDHLTKMGAKITFLEKDGCLPLTITGNKNLTAFDKFELPVASAQVKSAVMLATLYTDSPHPTRIIENTPTRNHTEFMLKQFGANISTDKNITIQGGNELQSPGVIHVPADPSSSAFFIAAALMVPGSKITLPKISTNPTRTGFIEVCKNILGLDIAITNITSGVGEGHADITAIGAPPKEGHWKIPPEVAPSMIDEYPILAVLAASMRGSVTMQGIGELRVKESDRIAAMQTGLQACGVQTDSTEDSMTVHGTGRVADGATIATHLDHRIAMSFIMLGLIADNPITIDDVSPIATSFPNFFDELRTLGVDYSL